MSLPQPSTAVGLVTGTAGASFPWWNDLVTAATGVSQFAVSALGIVVLVLTVRKLWKENRKLDAEEAQRLRDAENGGGS